MDDRLLEKRADRMQVHWSERFLSPGARELLRDSNWQAAGIAGLILLFAIIPWMVPIEDELAHNILHHLNFIPLMVAGMIFGWRGALYASGFACLAQLPHVAHYWTIAPAEASDQVIELSIFSAAGLIAGFLSDRERKQRLSLEKTKIALEEVHEELRQNVETMKKAERLYAAGQLSASLAHEIRNPLASISGAAGILKRGHASERNVKECLEIIEKESQRLNKLLTNFLSFARPRVPRLQSTDCKAVINAVTTLATHLTPENFIEVQTEIADNFPEIECDPEQLKQVLLNLLINAIQATSPEETIVIRGSIQHQLAVLEICDRGCGISKEQLEHIFDPFFTTKDTGTGLGLAVASMIIEQHGGHLTGRNNPDKGMTFRVELPLHRRQEQ